MRDKLGAKPPAESIDWLNILVYGEPGAGKTHLLGTAQDHADTSPLLIADVDGGVATLRRRKDIDVVQVRSFNDLAKLFVELFDAVKDDSLPYKTVGIDSLSEFAKVDIGEISKTFASMNDKLDEDIPDMRAYAKSGNHVRRIVRRFRDLPCNVIFTCHTQNDRDNFNRLIYRPQLPGKLQVDIPGFLDIVGWLRAEVTDAGVVRYLQTQKTEVTIAKDRTNALDAVEENPTIPALWDKLKASN